MPRTPASPATATDHSASHGRASAATDPQASAEHSGPAAITATRRSADGLLQLQIRREVLAANLREARLKHRSTSEIMAELREVTRACLSY